MKILLTFLFLLTTTSRLLSSVYYVAPAGSDFSPGTINTPWATWQKAFTGTSPGDTVYFRGGVYYPSSAVQASVSGTSSAPIVFLNYPLETPILDGITKTTQSHGILLDNLENIVIKGLVIRNNRQIVLDDDPSGIVVRNCRNIIIERCTTHDNGKRGFYIYKSDNILITNCDSYSNSDPLQSVDPGAGGDGFMIADDNSGIDTLSNVVLSGCRSWRNSGNGFNMDSEGFIGAYKCWSFNNGLMNGKGYGFKLGPKDIWTGTTTTRHIERSIAVYNKSHGFMTFDNNSNSQVMQVFNNTAFRNGINPGSDSAAYGFYVSVADLGSQTQNLARSFKNNLAYDNSGGDAFAESENWYTHEYNNWDSPLFITVTPGDFVSLDSAGLTNPRNIDGSLPDIPFLKLSPAGQLIDVGTALPGIIYYSGAPDPGAFEAGSVSAANNVPYVVITSPACGTVFAEPATITIVAEAFDSDGSVSRVEFFENDIKIGEATSPPWQFIWSGVMEGNYALSAVATDNEGTSAPSSAIMINVVDTAGFDIEIFPNPNYGQMTMVFKRPLPETTDLYLYDFKGVTLYHDRLMESEMIRHIDLSGLPDGLYIFRMLINNKPYYYKIVVQ